MESVVQNVLWPMAGSLGVCNSTDWPRSSHDVTAHWHSLSMLITADSRARFSQNRHNHLSYYCATGSGQRGRSIFAIFGPNPRCCPGIITAECTWNMFLLGLVLMCPLQYMSYRQYNCHKNGKNNRGHYYFSKIAKLWFIIYCKPVYHTLLDILIAYVETNLLKCFCFRSAECFV